MAETNNVIGIEQLAQYDAFIKYYIDEKESKVSIATDSTPGIVMVDGDTIVIDESGTIAARSALAANELTYAETMAILNTSS